MKYYIKITQTLGKILHNIPVKLILKLILKINFKFNNFKKSWAGAELSTSGLGRKHPRAQFVFRKLCVTVSLPV